MWWSVLRGGVRYDRIFCMDFGGCDWIDLGVYLLASIDQIISDIVELSLGCDSKDEVRNIYTVYLTITRELGKVMKSIREGER